MHWELDFNTVQAEISDPFAEIPNKVFFDKCINEVWNQRESLPEITQAIDKDEYEDPACQLELEHVIGRRAYDRRNNIGIDCLDRILYSASSLMVFMEENHDPAAAEQNPDGSVPKIK